MTAGREAMVCSSIQVSSGSPRNRGAALARSGLYWRAPASIRTAIELAAPSKFSFLLYCSVALADLSACDSACDYESDPVTQSVAVMQ